MKTNRSLLPSPTDDVDERLAAEVTRDYGYMRRRHLHAALHTYIIIPVGRIALQAGVCAAHRRRNTCNVYVSIMLS